MTCPDCKRNEQDAMERDKLAEELAWYKAAYEANARLTGSERAHDEPSQNDTKCPKHFWCLPESCGDCPYDQQDASDTTRNMQESHAFAKRFPELVGHVGTHYPECYKSHPSCAWRVGYEDGLNAKRT